jgi:hypothetical protein
MARLNWRAVSAFSCPSRCLLSIAPITSMTRTCSALTPHMGITKGGLKQTTSWHSTMVAGVSCSLMSSKKPPETCTRLSWSPLTTVRASRPYIPPTFADKLSRRIPRQKRQQQGRLLQDDLDLSNERAGPNHRGLLQCTREHRFWRQGPRSIDAGDERALRGFEE